MWSFASRGALHKVQNLQDRVERLSPGCSHLSIHRHNCELLLKEIFKTKHSLNPCYMKDVFEFKETFYATRACPEIKRPPTHTTTHGLQTASYIGAKLWDSLPKSVRGLDSVDTFMSDAKKIPDLGCQCRLCAEYISGLGYIT